MRVRAYVDGFNLYYGSLKGTPFKWLDLRALIQSIAPGHTVDHIRYFTARVSGKVDPDIPHRQNAYLRALESLGIVTIHYGKFLSGIRHMPLAQPVGSNRFADVIRTEEKGSDVNLATWLLLDGADNLYDLAIVISNDSDLMDAVQQAASRFGAVWVVNPNVLFSNALKRAATRYLPLPAATLAAAQFPDPIRVGKARIAKPKGW